MLQQQKTEDFNVRKKNEVKYLSFDTGKEVSDSFFMILFKEGEKFDEKERSRTK